MLSASYSSINLSNISQSMALSAKTSTQYSISPTFPRIVARLSEESMNQVNISDRDDDEPIVIQTKKMLLCQFNSICTQIDNLTKSISSFMTKINSSDCNGPAAKMNNNGDICLNKIADKLRHLQNHIICKNIDTERTKTILNNKRFISRSQNKLKSILKESRFKLYKSTSFKNSSETTCDDDENKDPQFLTHYCDATALPSKTTLSLQTKSLQIETKNTHESLVTQLRCKSSNVLMDKTAEKSKDQTVNLFKTIFNLYKINYVDKQQLTALKHCLVRKDRKVINALIDYEINRDIKKLVIGLNIFLN